ncbi:type III-B CRISPR module-associated protein Cmr5 [Paludifilum halophilum]|uniref:CRISPR type III-B/RAMP module-associated protein Cmr5 n=1 Tax=Paludifilum halophilum TaxID=1642702 RepID=A0A235B3P6_9BACL|nr:type III-B CRISPR module-associated protein Cmr5 [Paludifilum halophilum]OYD06589.1 type III-B CRISPR module-associated protein Cmr5 [Paludifilum halophilum]
MQERRPSHDQPTMDQRRAEDVLKKIRRLQDQCERCGEKKRKQCLEGLDSYADYVERLPAAILTNGLGQALAQLLAAAKRGEEDRDPHYWLYRDVQEWLCREDPEAPYREGDILQAITRHGRQAYMQAQAEALAWLEWHKKLAVAYLKQPEGNDR